tara:strand:+ start:273 stop:572 length:300 start_codon:yes stop_codon:yes gene_type:complete
VDWFKRFINLSVTEWWRHPEPEVITQKIDEVENIDSIIFKLQEKGFHFNVKEDWYERTWVVATKDGAETSKEVYQRKGEHWKVVMFGDNGDVFFEKTIP